MKHRDRNIVELHAPTHRLLEKLNVFSNVFLHVCEEERWHVLQKFIDEVHRRAAIDRFLHSQQHSKP